MDQSSAEFKAADTTRDDAVRALKDRKELFVDGKSIIKFGKHHFSVNEQDLELSIVPREGKMCFHLSGTNFFEPVKDEAFLATEAVWDQEVIARHPLVAAVRSVVIRYPDRVEVKVTARRPAEPSGSRR